MSSYVAKNKHKITHCHHWEHTHFEKWYIRGKELSIYPSLPISTVPLDNQIVDKRNFFVTDIFLPLSEEE